MQDEKNKNVEEQLRRYAQERRQGGDSFELSPFNRQRLHDEAARKRETPRPRAQTLWADRGWLPWAMGFGLVLLMGGFWWFDRQKPATQTAFLSRSEPSLEPASPSKDLPGTPQQLSYTVESLAASAPAETPGAVLRFKSRILKAARKDSETDATTSAVEDFAYAAPLPPAPHAPEPANSSRSRFTSTENRQPSPIAPSASSSVAFVAGAGAEGRVSSPGVPSQLTPGALTASPSSLRSFAASAQVTPSAATDSPPTLAADGLALNKSDVAETKSTLLLGRSVGTSSQTTRLADDSEKQLAQTPADKGRGTAGKTAVSDLDTIQTPTNTSGLDVRGLAETPQSLASSPAAQKTAAVALLTGLNRQPDLAKFDTVASSPNLVPVESKKQVLAEPFALSVPKFQVLESFDFVRRGDSVTITDADGSVYRGSVSAARDLAALQAPALNNLSEQVKIPGLKTETLRENIATPSPATPTAIPFRVTGTNTSLQVEVAFDGYLTEASADSAAAPSDRAMRRYAPLAGGALGGRNQSGESESAIAATQQLKRNLRNAPIDQTGSNAIAKEKAAPTPAAPPQYSTVVGRVRLGPASQSEIRAPGAPAPTK